MRRMTLQLFKLFGNSERDKIAQVYNLSNVGLQNFFYLETCFEKYLTDTAKRCES